MIDLASQHLSTVRAVIDAMLPEVPVFAFGSRVKGLAKKHSDLDLALWPERPLHWLALALLREAFEESDLPIRVDVVDWSACSPEFKRLAGPLIALDAATSA